MVLFCLVLGLGRLGALSVGGVHTWVPDNWYGWPLILLSIGIALSAKQRLGAFGRIVTALATIVVVAYGLDMFLKDAFTSALLVWIVAYIGIIETGSTT
jgi:TM2 domain-containing membrane protein YozV